MAAMGYGSIAMTENNPERLVVVTSLPEGLVSLSPGERSMIEHEAAQVEQASIVDHSFPPLVDAKALVLFDEVREHFTLSESEETVEKARDLQRMHPAYLPAHVFEELGLNIAADRDLNACVRKCLMTIELGQAMVKGTYPGPMPPTSRPVKAEHAMEMIDTVRYNLADRYMRLGRLKEALDQLRLSQSLPKTVEQRVKRALKEASLLFALGDMDAYERMLRIAKSYGSDLFGVLRDRMALDGHPGLGRGVRGER
jgi:hypothetical protein